MDYAVDQFLETARSEGLREVRADHARSTGWFSSEVLAMSVTTTSMRKAGKVEYCMLLRPLYKSPSDIHSCVGAVVNIEDQESMHLYLYIKFCLFCVPWRV